MKHDEEMNYNCKKCNKKISAHNKDWHDGMCDDCFNKKYYKKWKDSLAKLLLDLKSTQKSILKPNSFADVKKQKKKIYQILNAAQHASGILEANLF